jgi:hypothetical protein
MTGTGGHNMLFRFVYFGSYVNAPAGDEMPRTLFFLRNIICEMGKKYGTIKGRDFAKGKHYLKHKIPGCRGRHIKLMLQAVENAVVHNISDSKYVWRIHKETYAKIFHEAVKFVEENRLSLDDEIEAEKIVAEQEIRYPAYTYSELMIRQPLVGLDIVEQAGNTEKNRNAATRVRVMIRDCDKRYDTPQVSL